MQGKSTIRGLAPTLALLALLGTVAAARAAPPGPLSPGLSDLLEARPGALPVGAWVRYTLLDKRKGKAVSIRLAAFGKEGGGRWFEVSITDERRQTMVYRTLVEDLGSAKAKTPAAKARVIKARVIKAPAKARVIKAIVQPPLQRPLLLPDALARRQLPPVAEGRYRRARLVGSGTIKTPTGSFKAKHYRRQRPGAGVEHAWLSEQIPGWPLVRFRSSRVELDLTGHGKDAESEIRGRPVRLDPRMLRHLPKP